MLILPFELNQVLTNEKSEKSEKAIWTPSSGPERNLKQRVLLLTQSEKSLLAYTAHTLAKIKWYVSGPHNFFILFQPLKVLSSHLNWGARLDSFDPLLNNR
jgi:hypothetical protein